MAWGSTIAPPSGVDDHLAEDLTALERDLAFGRALEREHPIDHRPELALEGQAGDPEQLVVRPAVAAEQLLLPAEEIPDVGRANRAGRRAAGHESAVLPEGADGPLPRAHADRLD